MKEAELRAAATCALCNHAIGKSGLPPESVIWSTPPCALFGKDQPNAALKEIS